MVRIAIVGLGPWGICALERVVTTARSHPELEVDVHVIEPRTPGSGVYDVRQPDYLLLNNPCGQISLFPYAGEDDEPGYAVGLHGWAVAQGYTWVDERCVIDPAGAPIEAHHFVPRRVMGEYLQWFYRALVADAPAWVKIVLHPTSAVDIVSTEGTEEIRLEDGPPVVVDHVIVTSGHTANADDGAVGSHPHHLPPYPVTAYLDAVSPDSTVAVSGLGLVGLDVMVALTVGRGGRFADAGDGRLRYEPSGGEPRLQMFSRSGLAYNAKSVTGTDRSDVYVPAVCTPDALLSLRGAHGSSRGVDVRRGLLPLLFAEMYVRYYAQVAYQAAEPSGGRAAALADARAVRAELGDAWRADRFGAALASLAERYGPFDAEELFFGHHPRYPSSEAYQRSAYEAIESDLVEAQVPGGRSAIKEASEVWRIFRDPIRSVIEYGGPSLDSYLDFHADIRSRINRLVAGPPALRSQQLLALLDAGVLSLPYGPAPALGPAADPGPDGLRTRISSTMLATPYSGDVDFIIRGHLEEPRIDGSASQLLTRLYRRGRVSQFRYGSVTVGSVDLTADAHPISVDGVPQPRIWMFGVLTEGVRHFTHYIPSPKSRIRAFEDIGACVHEILG